MAERQADLSTVDTDFLTYRQPYVSTPFGAPSTSPLRKNANDERLIVSGMFNKLQGQPDSYDKKFVYIISKPIQFSIISLPWTSDRNISLAGL